MIKTFITAAVCLLAAQSFAQTNTFPSSGNVGIGTTSPVTTLDVMDPFGELTSEAKMN